MTNTLMKYLPEVCKATGADFMALHNQIGARMSAKLRSEILSAFLEVNFERYVPGAAAGYGDNEADVYLKGTPLEIKTAFKARQWRGGEYSKRKGDFLLVSWDWTEHGVVWFAVHSLLTASDWVSSGSANYYATSITLDAALQRDSTILVGNVRTAKKLTHPVYCSP